MTGGKNAYEQVFSSSVFYICRFHKEMLAVDGVRFYKGNVEKMCAEVLFNTGKMCNKWKKSLGKCVMEKFGLGFRKWKFAF